ncbi:hypothetical protein [Yoonia sp.]|uniref:hypothetical protein n=1 Tax=Yoonia sp. TaxID=2212373 RepID=UPI002FDA1917
MIATRIGTKLRGLAMGAVLAGSAAVMATPSMAEDWSGQVTLYGWGAGVTGDFTPFSGAPTLSFDKSLSEVLEDLDGAFFVTGLARRGDLVLFGDYTYSASSRSGVVGGAIPAAGELTIQSLTLAGGRRIDVGGGGTLDVLAGLRAWGLEGSVTSPVANLAPEQSFVDPIVALRSLTPVSDRVSVLAYLDVGGFGVGSEFTWLGTVTANYQATDSVYISAGWRHLYVDYAEGGTAFEGAMTGPVIGATLRF